MVVLPTELEVDKDYSNLTDGDEENRKNEEEEAKHIVKLVLPDCSEYKKEFDEHCSEREDSGH